MNKLGGHSKRAYFEGDKNVFVFKPVPKGRKCANKKMTNEQRLKSMGTKELAKELTLIANWDKEQLKRAQKGPGVQAFMEDWLRSAEK